MNEPGQTDRGALHQLFDRNFLDYSSYVIRERAIPDVDDGLKPVQRRILQTLFNMHDGRFHKVANVVGETMKLHPHGDQSIFDALVNLANKEYLIERQGNFGNIYTGDQASAARYIECRLTPLALETLFHKDLTEFIDSYDGRMQEPLRLPARIPLLLLLGAEGIAVGMATKIMPHNFNELLQAQIDYLQGKDFALYPDFPRGGIIDASDYQHGNGRLRCRARLEQTDERTVIIRELPAQLTTQALIESIEKAAKANKLKIAAMNDYTAEQVEVEIKLARGVFAEETLDALYAFTDCELSVSPSLMSIVDHLPRQMEVEEVLKRNTDRLAQLLEADLRLQLERLEGRWHERKLEQVFIEERLYKLIEEKTQAKEVLTTMRQSLAPFAAALRRAIVTQDVERLLEIKIRRISRHDINRQRKELQRIEEQMALITQQLTDMRAFAIAYLRDLLQRYGPMFPRKSELRGFDGVSARNAALCNLVVGYQRQSGFIGSKIKADEDKERLECLCSEYDRLLLFFKDGSYKAISVAEKIFVGPDLRLMTVVKPDLVFTLIYRQGSDNLAYLKRFATPKFILNREYRLFSAEKGSTVLFLAVDNDGLRLRMRLAPSTRAKSNMLDIDSSAYQVKGASARGKRLASRPVRRISELGDKEAKFIAPLPLPGLEGG